MTDATSFLPGMIVSEGLAPDIAGRITMALAVVERVRTGLAEKLAAFADVPAAFLTGLQRLGDDGGLAPTALAFGVMLATGLAAERLLGLRRGPRPKPGADGDIGSRLAELLLSVTRDLGGLLIFAVAAVAVMLLAGGRGQVVPAVLLTYLGAGTLVPNRAAGGAPGLADLPVDRGRAAAGDGPGGAADHARPAAGLHRLGAGTACD